MENREKIKLHNRFDDLSECTEYYYDELGKLMEMSGGAVKFKKKDQMKLYGIIMDSYFMNLAVLNEKMKANKAVDKREIKEFNAEYKNAHKKSYTHSLKAGLRKLINKISKGKYCVDVELIAPGQSAQAIAPGQSDEQARLASSLVQDQDIEESSDDDYDDSTETSERTDISSPAPGQDEVLDF